MSRDLRELAVVATRGTVRAELPSPLGASVPALTHALDSVPGETPEALLLGRAALLGLHARAGAPLARAATPPPTPLAAPERPMPSALAALLPALAHTDAVLLDGALSTVAARNWTLNAVQILALHARNANLARTLWTLADQRARATLDAHPLHKQAQKAEEQAAWAARLAALAERRVSDPAEAVRALQDLWASEGADRRRELLALVRRDLRPEDRPLLEGATRDRSPELQKQARQLLGHLPGPLQDELRALLPQAVKVSGLLRKKITFGAFDLPAALGKPRAGQYDDSDLHRLLGALPTDTVLSTLKVGWDELHKAMRDHHWSLAHELSPPRAPAPTSPDPEAARARLRDLVRQPEVSEEKLHDAVAALGEEPDLTAESAEVQTALAVRTFGFLQRSGLTWHTRHLTTALVRGLSPDLTVPPPTPRPFEMPPRPKKLPTWQTPAEWEERQRNDHASNEYAAMEAWRELDGALRVRRAWRDTLAAHP